MLEEELKQREWQLEEQAGDGRGNRGRSRGVGTFRRQLAEANLAQPGVGGAGELVLLVLLRLLWWKWRQARADLELRCGGVRVEVQWETVRNKLEDTLEKRSGEGLVSRR